MLDNSLLSNNNGNYRTMKQIHTTLSFILCLMTSLLAQQNESHKHVQIRIAANATHSGINTVYLPEITIKDGQKVVTKWHTISINTFTSLDTYTYEGGRSLEFYQKQSLESPLVGKASLPAAGKSFFLLFVKGSKPQYKVLPFPFKAVYGQHTLANLSKAEIAIVFEGRKHLLKPQGKVTLKPEKKLSEISLHSKIEGKVRVIATTRWTIEKNQHEFVAFYNAPHGRGVLAKHIMLYKLNKTKTPNK